MIVGSTPTSVTDETIAWSNGKDTWVTTRKLMVRFHPRSFEWSVGVPAARVRGKDEDRVQFPDGPLENWACMPLEATDPCKVGEVGSTPIRSTGDNGLMVQRDDTALAWRRSGFDSRWVH
jgi:hypothetical protein